MSQLRFWAAVLRTDIISMLVESGSGHTAGPLGLADIFTALYFQVLKHNPSQPDWPERDRLVLSAGHNCPVLYAAMAETGYFPRALLFTLRKFGSPLQGHPHNLSLPGIESSSGPLGQGLSQAAGMAWALKNTGQRVFTVLSDGEHQEGQTWEAIMWAGHNHLHNLIAIIDRNRIQISGNTEQILGLDPLADKYISFGWKVLSINGNNMSDILGALQANTEVNSQPLCIIANTTPGKGVDFMENDPGWHGRVPTPEEAERAYQQLNGQLWK